MFPSSDISPKREGVDALEASTYTVSMRKQGVKCWTVEEANRALPLVSRIVEDILELGRELKKIYESHESEDGEILHELSWQIEQLFDELRLIGCEYNSTGGDKGLVDFPSKIEERSVLLCWAFGEESIQWYHSPDEGFSSRRPIPTEFLSISGAITDGTGL
ncbi:MAG: DUF2203 domain-containing protein [Planctomycetota bacterium]|jgi:hypothetical protein|nr:DUF2203 domain-containing protein [Planctomycetota bacterium]